MASYERWMQQHQADEWFESLGFKEKTIHGIRLYYNESTGESLDLDRPKLVYLKTVQHGVHLAEGTLERLVDTLKGIELDNKSKKIVWDFILQEKNELNKILQETGLKDNR